MPHLHLPHTIFMPDALPAAILPIYPGLREAPVCWVAYWWLGSKNIKEQTKK